MKNEETPSMPVGIGEIGVIRDSGRLEVYGLGSCVCLILFDEKNMTAGLAHILLPGPRLPQDSNYGLPAKYADEAIEALVNAMGVRRGSIRAGIVGGATIFAGAEDGGQSIGRRNIDGVKRSLGATGIPVSWEDSGGDAGRSVIFTLPGGGLRVRTLREGWKTLSEGTWA